MKVSDLKEQINDEWFDHPMTFITYKKPVPVKYRVAANNGTIETLEGPVNYQAGFYIMTGPQGEEYPIPKEKFNALYDDLGNDVATPKKIVKKARLADHNGIVNTSWGEPLHYTAGNDYIVRHGSRDYGAVKKDIFQTTYDTSYQKVEGK
jgi:hypothetical protein